MTAAASQGTGNKWEASVTVVVHDAAENPISDVLVSGTWGGGASESGACTTDSAGTCTVTLNNIRGNIGSVDFTVDDLILAFYTYSPADNHDPGYGWREPSVTILKPKKILFCP